MPSYQKAKDEFIHVYGNSSEKKKSNSLVLSISVAEMNILHSYANMVPSNCIHVIPFNTSLESDKRGASHCPHRCTTLAGGLNYSQKIRVYKRPLFAFAAAEEISTHQTCKKNQVLNGHPRLPAVTI